MTLSTSAPSQRERLDVRDEHGRCFKFHSLNHVPLRIKKAGRLIRKSTSMFELNSTQLLCVAVRIGFSGRLVVSGKRTQGLNAKMRCRKCVFRTFMHSKRVLQQAQTPGGTRRQRGLASVANQNRTVDEVCASMHSLRHSNERMNTHFSPALCLACLMGSDRSEELLPAMLLGNLLCLNSPQFRQNEEQGALQNRRSR